MLRVQTSRIINKRSVIPGVIPTIGPTTDHTDGSWVDNEIYPGEFFVNLADEIVYFGWITGSTTTPSSGVTQMYPYLGPTPSGQTLNLIAGTGLNISGTSPNYWIQITGGTGIVGWSGNVIKKTFPANVNTNDTITAPTGSNTFLGNIFDTYGKKCLRFRAIIVCHEVGGIRSYVKETIKTFNNDGSGLAGSWVQTTTPTPENFIFLNDATGCIDMDIVIAAGGPVIEVNTTPCSAGQDYIFRLYYETTIVSEFDFL